MKFVDLKPVILETIKNFKSSTTRKWLEENVDLDNITCGEATPDEIRKRLDDSLTEKFKLTNYTVLKMKIFKNHPFSVRTVFWDDDKSLMVNMRKWSPNKLNLDLLEGTDESIALAVLNLMFPRRFRYREYNHNDLECIRHYFSGKESIRYVEHPIEYTNRDPSDEEPVTCVVISNKIENVYDTTAMAILGFDVNGDLKSVNADVLMNNDSVEFIDKLLRFTDGKFPPPNVLRENISEFIRVNS